MFDPTKVSANAKQKAMKKDMAAKLKAQSLHLIPPDLQVGLQINIKEVVCGDPACAPIDTIFSFVWAAADKDQEAVGRGMFGMPMEIQEVEPDDLVEMFPDEECLRAWHRGERVNWPPQYEPEPLDPESLRFTIGSYVECRVGPDPVTGWAPGRIIKVVYREDHWPPGVTAPYQIELSDGRLIFAPQDTDAVIRPGVVPPPSSAPSSSGAIGGKTGEEVTALARELAEATQGKGGKN
jgi:hypothetical protein